MARCRQCNLKVRRAAEYCPHYGVHDPAQRNPLMPARISAPIGIFVLGAILFVALWSSGGGGGGGGGSVPVSPCKSDWTKCTFLEHSDGLRRVERRSSEVRLSEVR
jgi:hypothetical protein